MSFLCNISKWIEANMPASFVARGNCKQLPYYDPYILDMLAGQRDSIDPMIQAQMGICGTNKNLNAASVTTAVGVKYYALQCIIAGVIDTAVTKDKGATITSAGTELDGIVIPAGMTLYGEFSEINITSGVFRAYEHPFN